MPGGDVHNWTNRFTGRIRAATIAAAPVNKRPRWGHYGKPLKATIVSARPRFWANGRDKMRVYGAVGATADHAYYVDQGTGVYAGNAAYPAKIIPPWTHDSPSLYEATWRPGGPGTRRVKPVIIKGQKGQFFFDTGLKHAFQSMRMRSFQVPNDPKISTILNSVATGLEGFFGNTPDSPAFRASLAEWRAWRDAAWKNNEGLGRNPMPRSKSVEGAVAKAKSLKKPSKPRPKKATTVKPKSLSKPKKGPVVNVQQRKADRAQFIAAMIKKYGSIELPSVRFSEGYWYATVPTKNSRGQVVFKEVRAKAKS